MASTAIFQLSCFSSIYRRSVYRLPTHRSSFPNLRPKILVISNSDEGATNRSKLETKAALSYTDEASVSQNGSSSTSYSATDSPVPAAGQSEEDVQDEPSAATEHQKAAKIHDFCLGIPYGGLILTSGLIGFAVSRNPATLRTGVFFGGPLLALSTLSLNVWRTGKSSLPFMLGQAVLAAVLMWKSGQTYSLTKTVFPTGLYVVISAAMLLFYSYVVLSGGNPPPKKKKLSSSTAGGLVGSS